MGGGRSWGGVHFYYDNEKLAIDGLVVGMLGDRDEKNKCILQEKSVVRKEQGGVLENTALESQRQMEWEYVAIFP